MKIWYTQRVEKHWGTESCSLLNDGIVFNLSSWSSRFYLLNNFGTDVFSIEFSLSGCLPAYFIYLWTSVPFLTVYLHVVLTFFALTVCKTHFLFHKLFFFFLKAWTQIIGYYKGQRFEFHWSKLWQKWKRYVRNYTIKEKKINLLKILICEINDKADFWHRTKSKLP